MPGICRGAAHVVPSSVLDVINTAALSRVKGRMMLPEVRVSAKDQHQQKQCVTPVFASTTGAAFPIE